MPRCDSGHRRSKTGSNRGQNERMACTPQSHKFREKPWLVNISLIETDSRVRKKINVFLSLTGKLIGF